MAILGAIEEGMGEFPRLFVTKSLMDGMASAAMARLSAPERGASIMPAIRPAPAPMMLPMAKWSALLLMRSSCQGERQRRTSAIYPRSDSMSQTFCQ